MPFDVTENTQTVIISAFEQLGKDSILFLLYKTTDQKLKKTKKLIFELPDYT